MSLFTDTLRVIQDKPDQFWEAVGIHLQLCFVALFISFLVSYPLGVYLSKRNRLSMAVLNVLYLGKIIPGLAVLAFLMPYVGVGFTPALIALIIFAIPTMLINTVIAFKGVDKSVLEAARGMGMDPLRILLKIETPLALPVVLTGVRTAVVEVIAAAALASFIGGGGLGDFIINGIALAQTPMLLAGAIPISMIAFGGDIVFGIVEKAARKRTGY
ncbi:ABC transporter permease [Cohnella sp.]|uniref:ABC transporter permease n=1 Tax=Cohnella sp. TaxID=1883426 RepID=UPI00356A856B